MEKGHQESSVPWDRLPREAPKVYLAFIAYWDLGPYQSIKIVIEKRDSR